MHLFIFRRDLRVVDNKMFSEQAKHVVQNHGRQACVFIFNKQQIDPSKNKYFSYNTVQFMLGCLHDLDLALDNKLNFFEADDDIEIIQTLHAKHKLESIAFNRDITPFARHRDERIIEWCKTNEVLCICDYSDYILIDPLTMSKPYQVFGAYYKKYIGKVRATFETTNHAVRKSNTIRLSMGFKSIYKYMNGKHNEKLAVTPGRKHALCILRRIGNRQFVDYGKQRDFMSYNTTQLSAYLKYGCVSVREVARVVIDTYGLEHDLMRELMWRAFYDQVIFHFPRTLEGQISNTGNRSLRDKYDKMKWRFDQTHFEAWKNGSTGFPIVDASMRQLNATGYMNNRSRMIVSSFLVKDLLIDWRLGEQYFASKLVDYYPSANNQGWTFASGSGADAQQFMRIFNPWLQSQKFDKDCVFIKSWVPELKDMSPKDIHSWFSACTQFPGVKYPKPIVVHKHAVKQARTFYKSIGGCCAPRQRQT